LLGVLTNFQISSEQFISQVLNIVGVSNNFLNDTYTRPLLILIYNVVLFPIGCARNLYLLRHASILIVVVVLYTTVVVIIQAPTFIHQNTNNDAWGGLVLANFNVSALTCFAVTTLAYACHTLVFPVRKELARADTTRMRKIIGRAVTGEFFLYVSIAALGYVSSLGNTPNLVVFRSPPDGEEDTLMTISRLVLTICLILGMALRINPCRLQVFLFTKWEQTIRNHCLITGVIMLITAGLAVAFPNVYTFFSIVGGTVGCLITLTIPGIVYIADSPGYNWKRIGVCIVTVIVTIAGFTAAIYSFVTSL